MFSVLTNRQTGLVEYNVGYFVGTTFVPVYAVLFHSGSPYTAIFTMHTISQNLASLTGLVDENWKVFGNPSPYGNWLVSSIDAAYQRVAILFCYNSSPTLVRLVIFTRFWVVGLPKSGKNIQRRFSKNNKV